MTAGRDRTRIGDLLWLPWTIVAFSLTLVWLALISLVMLPITLFMPFERFQVRAHPFVGFSTLFALSPLRTHVDPRYRFDKVGVIAQNHVSMLDGVIAVGAVRVPMCGLENAAHLKVPGYGWLLSLANAIPVRRSSGGGRFVEVANAVRERASRGISVLTFPEAHRTVDGRLRPFKRGVFRIARDAGLPIVPMAVRGIHRLFPKGTIAMRPARLEVYIAPQIETEGLSDAQLDVVMDRVRQVMEAWIDRGEQLGDLCLAPIPDDEGADDDGARVESA